MHGFDDDSLIYGAILLATKLGENKYADCPAWGEWWTYKDDIIEITKLANHNPVVCAALREDGTWERYRYHGEFVHVRDHFFQLIATYFIGLMTPQGAEDWLESQKAEGGEGGEGGEGAGGSK